MSKVRNIPKDWKLSTIGKLLKISTGNQDTQNKIKDGKYPFFVRSNIVEKLDSYSFDGEAVLTAGDGVGVGKVYHYYNGKFAFHQRVYAIYGFNQIINGKYFYRYFSENFLTEVERYSAKNSVDSVRLNMILDMELFLPPIKEQEKIAEILSEVDSAIEHAQALHVKHQKVKTALMQDLLTHGIDSNGKIRNPKTHAYKPSPLGDIPVEWNTDKLKNIASIIVSNVDKKSFNNEIHVKLCNYMDIYSNTYITNTISFMNATATNAEIRNFQLTQDDVVVTKDSESPFDIGIPAYILTNVENLICGYHLAILRTQKDILLGSWLSSILTIDYYKNYFASTASGSTRFGLPKSALENILVKFPNSKEEQQKIAQILSSYDEKIEKVKTKLEKLQQLKTALMQDLLNGTKRVNHLLGEEQ